MEISVPADSLQSLPDFPTLPHYNTSRSAETQHKCLNLRKWLDQISVTLEFFSPSSVADLLTLYPLLRPKSGFLKNRRAVKSCHEDLVVGNRGCTQGMGAVR